MLQCLMSLSARRAWIEIDTSSLMKCQVKSLSARRAWIEIEQPHSITNAVSVALRKESVDRNPGAAAGEYRGRTVALRKEGVDRNINQGKETRDFSRVALRKESVDRNSKASSAVRLGSVALRKESVDRNQGAAADRAAQQTSLSARRAWIEIFLNRCAARPTKVALRKESRECFSF